jgi:hypothetical protein
MVGSGVKDQVLSCLLSENLGLRRLALSQGEIGNAVGESPTTRTSPMNALRSVRIA